MVEPTPEHEQLAQLAERIEQHGLNGTARLVLDLTAPLTIVGSQLCVFARPLLPKPWQGYASLFANETNWSQLRRLLER